jgi:predicted ATPase
MSTTLNGDAAAAPARIFVGRERELGELRAGWRDVVAGRGRLFLIHGDAGIGKTRLAETVAAEAALDGALVAWGRCWEDGGAPALWPWIQIVRTLARGVDGERATRWLGRGADYLRQLMPELGDLLPSSVALEAPRPRTPETQFPMLEALAEFFANASAASPLVLILDDLHAADGPSLMVLDFLARELPQRRMLLLGTYREVEAQREGERLALLNRIARQGHHMPLAGLSEADSRRLIELAFVRAPAASVVRALHQNTEGNPFFLDEVVRLLIASPECARLDHIPAAGLPLPLAVRDAVRQRLQPLSTECRRVLQIASVVGRQFPFACLREVAAVAEETLLHLLDEAVASVLVTRPHQPHGDYRFVHALIRETLYDDLAAAERMQLHRRAGEALLAQYGTAVESHIAEVAHHFLEGQPAGDAPAAIELAVRAARRAESIAAFADAAQWYDRAWVRVAAQAPESVQCIELLLARGDAQSKAWSTDSARQTFRDAARLARAAVDRRVPEAALLFARATLGMGGTGIGMPRGSADAEMIDLLETAVALISGSAEMALEARLRSRLALEL